jgi:peroxiredoxin Q/BCP
LTRALFAVVLSAALLASSALAVDLKPGDPAPRFAARTHEGGEFRLEDRKGQWTVLYFYPWAGTSGCTRQADAFRDNIAAIRTQGAEVFGISTDTVESQAAFHEEEHLPFTLLADPEGAVATAYGAKMPILTMSRRWTFIIDPTLTVRQVEHDVNPAEDAQRVAAEIARLKGDAGAQP